ncbi:MAG: hypothetical protein WA208_00815 [Thermoanaerobaculia bacterium]
MSRPVLQILGVVALLALVAGGVLFIKQRRESERRDRQVAAMKSTLADLRDAIGSFRAANARHPASLAELVAFGQLPAVPVDPVTGSSTTWSLVTEERVVMSDDFATPAEPAGPSTSLIDVRSGAAGNDPSGKPWSSY